MAMEGQHKCQDCPRQIKLQFKKCRDCDKKDPFRGWKGVYDQERRKRI